MYKDFNEIFYLYNRVSVMVVLQFLGLLTITG